MDEPKLIKRRVIGGDVDAHPTEKALIVTYEIEAIILDDSNKPVVGERKSYQKKIKVENLNPKTNIKQLAREIIEKSSIIDVSKLPEVEQLLFYLQNRRQVRVVSNIPSESEKEFQTTPWEDNISANIADIDDYLEMLYEDIESRTKGTNYILQLARVPDNLSELYGNETVVSAMARVLREDWQAEVPIAINVIYFFFCFSMYSDFHPVIIHFKIGALTMQIVETELAKYDRGCSQLAKLKQGKTRDLAQAEEISGQLKELEGHQEKLFRVSFFLLFNLAEDLKVEMKMHSKNVVGMLVHTLRRSGSDLLIVVVCFLKKLSVFGDAVNDMRGTKIMQNLGTIFPSTNDDLVSLVLRLLLNLSFDSILCRQMVKDGLVPKLMAFIKIESHKKQVLCIFAHISVETDLCSAFASQEYIFTILKILVANNFHKPEILALCINLSADLRCASIMCSKNGFTSVLRRAFKHRDYHVIKIGRNISRHEGELKELFIEFLGDMAGIITANQNPENKFATQCIGILANLTIPDIDFELVVREYRLIDWIERQLLSESRASDDQLYLTMGLLSTLCHDKPVAEMVVTQSSIVNILLETLNDKQEIDEIVMQVIYVFYRLLCHPKSADWVINESDVPTYLMDLMHDKNTNIRNLCNFTLDLISEKSGDWACRIKKEKFVWYNSQWLEMVDDPLATDKLDQIIPDKADEFNKYVFGAEMLDNSDDEFDSNSLQFDDYEMFTQDPEYYRI